MQSKVILLSVLSFLFITTLNAQTPNAVIDGKITIGDDASTPVEGTIRYNSTTKMFEGYTDQKWVNLGFNCVCPYVTAPFGTQTFSSNFTLQNNKVQIFITFSHAMDPTSFTYGTNVIVSGTANTSGGGTLTWSNGNTSLKIETNEDYFFFNNGCFEGFQLRIVGTGPNPAKGLGGGIFDGDRDGCCGGDYNVKFVTIC